MDKFMNWLRGLWPFKAKIEQRRRRRETERQDKVIRAQDAQALLENKIFKDAITAIEDHIYARALATKTTDADACQDVVRALQVSAGVEREIKRFIADGKIQAITDERISMFRKAQL